MNVQAQMSGHISGQVPNQPGTQLPILSQQNGSALPPQLLPFSGERSLPNADLEVAKFRRFIQDRIYDFLMRRQNAREHQHRKILDLVRRLDEGLFKSARTKEEYLNLETLESRLHLLIARYSQHSHNMQFSQLVHSSNVVGPMIPTPGLSQNSSSKLPPDGNMLCTSGGNAMATTSINMGNLISAGPSAGVLPNGYQQPPSSFSVCSGNSILSSMGVERIDSQMIPTPGFNSNNNSSYMNIDTSSNGCELACVEATTGSHQQLQKQAIVGQNNRMLHNLGQIGIRSNLPYRPYGLANGNINGSLDEHGISECYLSGNQYDDSLKTLQKHRRPPLHGEGVRMANTDFTALGNINNPATSVESTVNVQNLGQAGIQIAQKSNSQLGSNSLNLPDAVFSAHAKSQSMDNPESSFLSKDELIPSQQEQQFHRQDCQFQQQFVQQDDQQKQQFLLKDDSYSGLQSAQELGSQLKAQHLAINQNEVFESQASEKLPSRLPNHFPNASMQEHLQDSRLLSMPSNHGTNPSSVLQNSHQMQLHQHHRITDTRNTVAPISTGAFMSQSVGATQGRWNSLSQGASLLVRNFQNDQRVQEEFHHRITGQDVAHCNNLLSSDGAVAGHKVTSTGTVEAFISNGPPKSTTANRERQFRNQQRWLLFLRHARGCRAPDGKCPETNCSTVQKLWRHMQNCTLPSCNFPRCYHSKMLINHFKSCHDPCPVCVPVRGYLQSQAKSSLRPDLSELPRPPNASSEPCESGGSSIKLASTCSPSIETLNEPSLKKMKSGPGPAPAASPTTNHPNSSRDVLPSTFLHNDTCLVAQSVVTDTEAPASSAQVSPSTNPVKMEIMESANDFCDIKARSEHQISAEVTDFVMQEKTNNSDTKLVKNEISDEVTGFVKQERAITADIKQVKNESTTLLSEHVGTKSGKSKVKGVSLIELFTPEQVREHITGLRQWVGQSKAKAEKNQAMEHSMSENSCQLCAVEKLTFEPPPIYCTPCGVRIKRNAMYYAVGTGETRHFFCIPCYNESRGDSILVDGTAISKQRMEKKRNDEETEEWWVQCDKCEAWQHQICALFNGRRNDGGQAEYTCPNCYISEVESGERNPLPHSSVLGAKDLPRTLLSDHIEQRLFRRLKQERQERARLQGKSYDEVPSADALVIRVVSSVDKKLEVKPRFLEIFHDERYPLEFPYKSKVILLFQKIEGVEVCLFGMYVQEFGSECQFPNQRRVYLSYLDSVKYFRPEIKAVTGEALRTFVYHEILIGYLEYCKKRGFTSCYIWACPPLKGEDYILYCHPEIQKTPKSDKLREWYLAMLRKATKEKIVADLTNLYDHFFVSTGECKTKVTAGRLPYFDGDYWPGAAEDMIYQIRQEEDARRQNKKGTMKKMLTKRALKASGQTDLSGNASKDLLLMHKLGETISPMKEDFIMVHLQHSCTHCCHLMVSGVRWVCRTCRNFQLCEKCYSAEQKLDDRERHPINQRDKHAFYHVEINDVPVDTKDKDEMLESEFFDTRQAFLSLCQGNHYQYDTLRRAKHSSMMVLYHLHNPTAPAFVTTCNACHLDIEAGHGWRCETCPDYDVCNACYERDGGIDHPHKLTNHPTTADQDAQNQEARQMRVVQLRKMLDLLVHASHCRSPQCEYPNCRRVKGLFRHGNQCRIRASGGCVLCKKMWYLLQLHARACKEATCGVPRCRDLKEHLRRLQQQSDSRRRAAVMEMMRQRAAEVTGNAS